uniref:Aminotransferase-like plant mobile domain-containing protein n=1 Tax=Fagus sylvatica TaxID=28930 RepID=A0A2N9I0C2_FAGSY
MASSSNDPDSLVTLRFHDFRVERMRHWWTLLGEDDHADIVGIFGKFPPFMRLQVDRGLLEALASFWDPTHCCFSIGEGPRSNRCLEKYLGLTTAVLRPEIARPEATWRKANISLDLLTKYFSRSAFPARLARDFIAGKKEWKKFRINAFKIAFAGDRERGFRCSARSSFSSGSAVTCSIFIASRLLIILRGHTVSQTVQIALPFTGDSRAWALYLLDLPLSGWVLEGYYPSLALRQFSGVQYPPRLGDLDARWSSSRRVRPEIALLPRTLSSGERGGLPFSPSGLQYGQVHHIPLISRSLRVSASTGQPERVTVLERELEEAQTELLSLRLARASEREASAARVESLRSTLHHNSVAVANLRRDLVAQRGNVSTLRTMNEFIREQLEISEDAKEQLEENLGRGSGAAGD